MSIGGLIKKARLAREWSQEKLGDLVGVSREQISYYENDKTRIEDASRKVLVELVGALPELRDTLAPLLQVSAPSSTIKSSSGQSRIRGVPLATWERPQYQEPNHESEIVPTAESMSPHSFALRVNDDSNEPRVPKGSVVLVDPEIAPGHEDFVVVKLPGHPEASLMQLSLIGGAGFLKPLNPSYAALATPQGRAKIIGVALHIQQTLRRPK